MKNKSIAVLAFANLSPIKENDYFSDGLSEEIINVLAKMPGVQVTSRASSFTFKNQSLDLKTIGSKLNVATIVDGSVRKINDQVRVTVQLINAQEDYHFWTDTYNYKIEDVFQIQDEIALNVAEKYREFIGHFNIDKKALINNNKSLEAYELSLRAKHFFANMNPYDFKLGIEFIDEAIKLEPDNSGFYGSKSIFYTALGIFGGVPRQNAYSEAYQASKRSLQLDKNNVNANTSMAYLSFCYDGDLAHYHKHMKKAISIEPNNSYALTIKSIVESTVGSYEECMDSIEKAKLVDPFSIIPIYLKGTNLFRLRRYEEALEVINGMLITHPNHLNANMYKGLVLLRLNKLDEAIAIFNQLPYEKNGTQPYNTGLGIAYAIKGNVTLAEKYMALGKNEVNQLLLAYNINGKVVINFLLGRYEEGFRELKKDVDKKAFYLKFYRSNPLFDPILMDPRSRVLDNVFISELPKSKKPVKYAKSGLSELDINRINADLNNYISAEKPFLDPNISLSGLASSINTSANNLSQIINTKTNNNFFDFINSYRIEELKRLLKSPKNKQFTILALAYQAGFNSKSTFNASFKKLTGKTPSEYIKQEKL